MLARIVATKHGERWVRGEEVRDAVLLQINANTTLRCFAAHRTPIIYWQIRTHAHPRSNTYTYFYNSSCRVFTQLHTLTPTKVRTQLYADRKNFPLSFCHCVCQSHIHTTHMIFSCLLISKLWANFWGKIQCNLCYRSGCFSHFVVPVVGGWVGEKPTYKVVTPKAFVAAKWGALMAESANTLLLLWWVNLWPKL